MNEIKMNDDNVEQLLMQHFQRTQDYIDDDGFAARVMSQLPVKQEFNPLIKYLVFWLPIIVVSVLVVGNLPILHLVHSASAFLIALSIKQMLLGGMLLTMLILSASYFLAFDNRNSF